MIVHIKINVQFPHHFENTSLSLTIFKQFSLNRNFISYQYIYIEHLNAFFIALMDLRVKIFMWVDISIGCTRVPCFPVIMHPSPFYTTKWWTSFSENFKFRRNKWPTQFFELSINCNEPINLSLVFKINNHC